MISQILSDSLETARLRICVWAGVEVGVCVQSLDLTLVVSETFQG